MAPRFDPESYDWAGLVKTEKAAWAAHQSPHSGRSYTSDLRGMTATEKANLVISDFTNAGALPPKAADQFIVGAVLQSVLLSMVHSDTYDTPSFNVPNTQFAGQILYAGTQGQGVPAGQRSKPTYAQQVLTFKEARGQVRIDDGVFENQIERSGLLNTIMGQINIGVGRDIENAAINGDTASGSTNSLLTLIDGFLKKSTSYSVTGSGATLDKNALKRLWKRLPRQHRREKRKMVFLTAEDAVVDYVDTLSNRIGDNADKRLVEGDDNPKWNTIPVVGIPLWPDNLGGTTDRTKVMLTDPSNLWIGFQRVVKMEQWRDPDAMQTVFNVSVKFDTTIAFEPATATYTDVLITTAS